ncbi:MAG: RND transporter [Desulfobacterales bacterium]|nr:MAG: RND transporter [Desulfobacterales bacterium]
MRFIQHLPLTIVLLAVLTVGLAPFTPEPHVVEKIKMLVAGTLTRPIDIFDLLFHLTPFVLLVLKVYTILRNPAEKG